MKILIYGTGTLGSVAGARLAQAGADMTVLARGSGRSLLALEALDRQFR
jgi:ketopantoate reductase